MNHEERIAERIESLLRSGDAKSVTFKGQEAILLMEVVDLSFLGGRDSFRGVPVGPVERFLPPTDVRPKRQRENA